MKRPFDDTAMEILVSRTLRIGVYGSTLFMLVGFLVSLFHPETLSNPDGHPSLTQFLSLLQPDSEFFTRFLNPFILFYLGILILLLTPIIRVVIAIVSFTIERDGQFITISVTVLFIILLSLYLSFSAR